MQSRNTYKSGFTIVELLIVIVVIGILAAIVIVAFNGIQTRANNTARIQTVKQFRTALDILATSRSTFDPLMSQPSGASFPTACFSNGLPDVNSDGAGDCHMAGGSVIASESTLFKTAVTSVSSLPSGKSYPEIRHSDGTVYLSPFIYSAGVDSVSRNVMEYSLQGNNVDCVLRPVVLWNGSSYTASNPSSQKYSATEDGGRFTVCIIDITPI